MYSIKMKTAYISGSNLDFEYPEAVSDLCYDVAGDQKLPLLAVNT